MLGWLTLILLSVVGYRTERLRWQQFAIIAGLTLLAVGLQSGMVTLSRQQQGRESDLFEPSAFISSWAMTAAFWSIIFLVAFAIGRWRRNRSE